MIFRAYQFALAIDVPDGLHQRHDTMPPNFYCLIAERQRLRNSLSIGVLGQAVAAVFHSWNFPYGDLSFCHAVLNP